MLYISISLCHAAKAVEIGSQCKTDDGELSKSREQRRIEPQGEGHKSLPRQDL